MAARRNSHTGIPFGCVELVAQFHMDFPSFVTIKKTNGWFPIYRLYELGALSAFVQSLLSLKLGRGVEKI